MEENVALDSSKQKQFVKSIRGIKKILKRKDGELQKDSENVKIGKIRKSSRKKRGLVYLSHIPHGFYEHQMTEYFKQFGVVTNARVIRSKRTGMSKGYAFVEFRDPNVAQIVAETMNNYLMGKRLIKAAIIPPEEQRFAKRKNWNAQYNPGNNLRQKMKKAHNAIKDDKEELKIARKLISNLNKTKRRLRELDIDYDFFTPVDIPEPLLNLVEVKKEDAKTTDVIKTEKKSKTKVKQEENADSVQKKKKKKANDIEIKAQVPIPVKQGDDLVQKKSKKSKEFQESDEKTSLGKASTKDTVNKTNMLQAKKNVTKESKDTKIRKIDEKNNKMSKTQKQKKKNLKDTGVKLPENFIRIQKESDDESDSSVNFDSDEFDNLMEQDDSDVGSEDGSDESDVGLDEDITSEEDVSITEESTPPKKGVKAVKTKIQVTQTKKPDKELAGDKPLFIIKTAQQKGKSSKKPKFEKKGHKKTINKVIKKKK